MFKHVELVFCADAELEHGRLRLERKRGDAGTEIV